MLSTLKGDMNLINLSVEELGEYSLNIKARAGDKEPDLGQIPLTVSFNNGNLGTITVVGSQKSWSTYTIEGIEFPLNPNGYLRFLFGQGGMEIDSIELVKK